MSAGLPRDPVMLLSVVNTKLRDYYILILKKKSQWKTRRSIFSEILIYNNLF